MIFFRKLSKPKEEINSHEIDSVSFRAFYIFAYLFHEDTDFCDLEVFQSFANIYASYTKGILENIHYFSVFCCEIRSFPLPEKLDISES